MKEHPILFSGDMVRAIIDGRKTQSRRVVKPQPVVPNGWDIHHCGGWAEGLWSAFRRDTGVWVANVTMANTFVLPSGETKVDYRKNQSPFGVPGDKLWLRETFCIETNYYTGAEHEPPFADSRPVKWIDDEDFGGRYWQQCHYRATDATPELDIGESDPGVKWSPSIHMPHWASHITLALTDVRVERVKDITFDDCRAEGCSDEWEDDGPHDCCDGPHRGSKWQFTNLWDSISKPGFKWSDNPWVWVLTFTREASR